MESKSSKQNIKTLGLLKEIDGNYYKEAVHARRNNRLVGWVNALSPVEILYAMDIIPIYPENHAAIIQARKMCPEIAGVAEAEGYSTDLCSYALCDIGSAISAESPVPGGLPRPDFLMLCNSQCGTLTKWFEVNSRRFDAPLFLIDIPYWGGKKPDKNAKNYVVRQFDELILFLEVLTGKSFDWDKFKEVLDISARTCEIWDYIIGLGRVVPSPLTVFDQFVAMSPIVAQRGTVTALEFYRKLKAELDLRVEEKVAAVPGEKYRLYWDNLPTWCSMRPFSEFLSAKKACLNANTYTWGWTKLAADPQRPFESWAETHLSALSLFYLGGRVKRLLEMIEEYKLNGFIIHLNRSCKVLSLDAIRLRDEVENISGVPGIVIEADHGDQRLFSESQVFGRLEAYFEILESKKQLTE
jgi:benzoyl-CoA reductase/2-hydroxyglutaryl-CoA dehydratase subunit BcrC/BadD/HgdB